MPKCKTGLVIRLKSLLLYQWIYGFSGQLPVYYDGELYWLADGFYRVLAAEVAGIERIAADIGQGTRRDAVLHSVGANACHGLRRTNVDKQRAVETLLRDEEWGEWSDNAIAKACSVSHPFVGKIRARLSLSCNRYKIARNVQRNGTVYTQNTTKIGTLNLLSAPKSKDKQLFPSVKPNPDVPPDESPLSNASLLNTVAIAHGKPDVVAVEIAIGVRHLTPKQLIWVISSAASNGLTDSQLKALIKAAKRMLNQRHHPEYYGAVIEKRI